MSAPRDWRLYRALEGGHMIFCAIEDPKERATAASIVIAYSPGLNKWDRYSIEQLQLHAERQFELSHEDKVMLDFSFDSDQNTTGEGTDERSSTD